MEQPYRHLEIIDGNVTIGTDITGIPAELKTYETTGNQMTIIFDGDYDGLNNAIERFHFAFRTLETARNDFY